MYYKYFKYVLEHKKNVFIECMKIAFKHRGKIRLQLIIHAFTHDLSKFLPCEFIPYVKYFYGNCCYEMSCTELEKNWDYEALNNGKSCLSNSYLKTKEAFNKACEHHYIVNKHHPEHWVGQNMPMKHIRFMVCDLKAMSRKFGGTAQEYYLQNYYKWDMTHETRHRLEIALNLIKEYNASICECSEEYYMNIDELIKQSEEHLKRTGSIYLVTVKENLNNLLKPACKKYGLDIYDLVKNAKK